MKNNTPKHTPCETGILKAQSVGLMTNLSSDTPSEPSVRLYKSSPERYTLQIRGLDYRKKKAIAYAYLDENNPIVRAVNAHEELLGMLKEATRELTQIHRHYHPNCVDFCPTNDITNRANNVIAKAEGQEG